MAHGINVGRFQVLLWPRWTVFFYRPSGEQREYALYKHIYRWVVYVWPIEVRLFR